MTTRTWNASKKQQKSSMIDGSRLDLIEAFNILHMLFVELLRSFVKQPLMKPRVRYSRRCRLPTL